MGRNWAASPRELEQSRGPRLPLPLPGLPLRVSAPTAPLRAAAPPVTSADTRSATAGEGRARGARPAARGEARHFLTTRLAFESLRPRLPTATRPAPELSLSGPCVSCPLLLFYLPLHFFFLRFPWHPARPLPTSVTSPLTCHPLCDAPAICGGQILRCSPRTPASATSFNELRFAEKFSAELLKRTSKNTRGSHWRTIQEIF